MTKRRSLPGVALALLHAFAVFSPLRAAPPPDDLATASRRGDLVTVKRLLAAKTDVTANDNAAAREANVKGHVEILRLLRAAGGSEKSAVPAAAPKKSGVADAQPTPAGLSRLLPAGPAPARKTAAKLRVAIVAEDALRPAADLLGASLTGTPFDLIERTELNRILDEHKLTTQLGAEGTRAAELGALLGADALVLLRKVQLGETASAEMRFVRVSPGIVLDFAYRAWPLADPSAWAADAAARLTALDARLREDRAIAVAVAAFRPLTDTPAAVALARDCRLLFQDRLARQPGFVLLERDAIDLVAREQSFGKAGAFWAGSYLLDGTVEPPANAAAPVAITLRLTPVAAGEAMAFSARGPRGDLPRLVAELTAQAAAALKLRAAPASELKAEAQRHLNESHQLAAVGLLLAAHRAAETAAAFGLDADDGIAWRLELAMKLIDWQCKMLGENSRFYPLRFNGWSEAWIDGEMNGAEWLRAVEWCDLGVEAVRLWQRLLAPALRSDDAKRAADFLKFEALFDKENFSLRKVLWIYESLNVAATTLDHADMHLRIYDALRETLEEALALADAKPAHAENAGVIAAQIARLSPELYRDKASLAAAFTKLLTRTFAADNTAHRVAIRQALFLMDGRSSTSHAPGMILSLRDLATRGSAPEDELMRDLYECLLPKDKKQQRPLSDKLFASLWAHRQMFVDSPRTIDFFIQICALVTWHVPDAPKFRERFLDTPKGQVHERAPEMLKLRRDLFLLIAKNAARPGPAYRLFDADYHPRGENAAELATLRQRVHEDDLREEMGDAPKKSAPPAPRPVLRGTPTYAKFPPLKISRRWTASPTPDDALNDLSFMSPAYDAAANTLRLFGERDDAAKEKLVHAYVFEIALPSLKTTAWPLPDFEFARASDASAEANGADYFSQQDFLYLARSEQFLAIGDRKTRQWKLNTEARPTGDFAHIGNALFLLTRSGGARGLSALSLRDHALTVLASNRRTPPQTPLDGADLTALSIKAGVGGLLQILTEPTAGDPMEFARKGMQKPRSLVTYDLAKQSWTKPRRVEAESLESLRVFHPLTVAGVPKAYKKVPDSNVWTLQTPRKEMPKVRVPLEFIPPDGRSDENTTAAMLGRSWYWTPHGYFITDRPNFARETIYFLPQSELDAYLDAHVPEEDESSVSPPAPVKP